MRELRKIRNFYEWSWVGNGEQAQVADVHGVAFDDMRTAKYYAIKELDTEQRLTINVAEDWDNIDEKDLVVGNIRDASGDTLYQLIKRTIVTLPTYRG